MAGSRAPRTVVRSRAGSTVMPSTAIQSRIEFLAKKSSRKMARGIDLDAARGSLSQDSSVWSKAQAAFATGNLGEAVTTAKSLKTSLEGLASTLKLELKGPA